VETTDDGRFHVRHVPVSEDGSFQDLWFSVSNGEVSLSGKVNAIVFGDLHVGDHDRKKLDATIDLCNYLVPNHVVLHDVFNGHSVNPHEANNGVREFHRIKNNRHKLLDEINEMLELLDELTTSIPSAQFVVSRSNHDQFLERYIVNQDWRKDVVNADIFSKCLLHLLENEDTKGVVPYFIEQHLGDRIKCLSRDESYRPLEYQLANHGDLGNGGSKGTPLQYAKMNTKQVTAHTHTPTRINGLLVAGTSTKLRLGWNKGPSSWSHSDVIEYNNGKATHIIYDEFYSFTTFTFPL